MINEIKLPNLGDNINSAEIIKLLVKTGDKVSKDQPVAEVSSDKATIEIPSDFEGIVSEIKVKEGDSIAEGSVILVITGEEAGKPVETESKPVLNETEKVIETKVELNLPVSKNEKSEILITETNHSERKRSENIAPAAPSVRRFAREIGININEVPGTGVEGRISIEDVKAFAKNLNQNRVETVKVISSGDGYHETLPDFSKWGEISREPMNNIRFKTAQHLSFAWNKIPHVTHFEKADITELERLRKHYAKNVEKAGGKLTMTSILIKIIASALKIFPKFNSSIDMDKKEIIYKNYFNIGLAVDTDRGLLVPVIRNADEKNITRLSVEVGEIAEKARNKKLTVEDMQGATFSISNLGGIGGTGFTPIVNSPEVAILGVSQSSYEPVYIDGKFEPRLIMPFSLSYDHRIIDGADAARFMKWVREALENPFLIILEG